MSSFGIKLQLCCNTPGLPIDVSRIRVDEIQNSSLSQGSVQGFVSETETPQLSVFMSDCRVNHCKRLPGGRTFKTQQIWFPTVSHSCNLLCVGLNIWINTIIILSKSHFNLQRWKMKKIIIYSLFFVKSYTQIWNMK